MGLLSWLKKINKPKTEDETKEIAELKAQLKKQEELFQSLQEKFDSLQSKIQQEPVEQVQKPPQKPVPRTFNGITLTDEQNKVLELLENTDNNYFVTGKAGSGKSTVLKCFKETTKKKNVVIVAPTGVAAINVDGVTIHSMFKLDFDPQDTKSKTKVQMDLATQERLKAIEVLIIDEISMVRSDIFDMMNVRLQIAKRSTLPFGGCQVIAFGDLFQLPPIIQDGEAKEFVLRRYGTIFFFGAPVVKDTFKILELSAVLRQKDDTFVSILNKIREGVISYDDVRKINMCNKRISLFDPTLRIVLTRAKAEKINFQKLEEIQEKEVVYETEITGDNPPSKNEIPFDYLLKLKKGALVMMTKNDPAHKYFNGSIGQVVEMDKDYIIVNINNENCTIDRLVYTKKEYKYNHETKELDAIVVGAARQFPIRLAYAITVHKAQGQTYDKIIIDFEAQRIFAAGQTYVALSRCKTLRGITLTRPLQYRDFLVDKEVVDYMKTAIKV